MSIFILHHEVATRVSPQLCFATFLSSRTQFFIDALSNFATAFLRQTTLPTTSRFDFHTSGTIYSFVKAKVGDVLSNLADRKIRFSGFAEL